MEAENAKLPAQKCPFKTTTEGEAFLSVQLQMTQKTQSVTDLKSEKSTHRDLLRAHREWSYFLLGSDQ